MTPEQIILLMEASAKQYTSLEAKFKAKGYMRERQYSDKTLLNVSDINTRWSGDKEYWKISKTTYALDDDTEIRDETITYSFTSKRTKKLTQEPGKTPRGLIRYGDMREAVRSFYTINLVLWENCDLLWKKMHDARDMSLRYDRISL